ncbi:DsbA family oxidoreductase [Sphingomonas sp. 10B4]|uniref:DsbA family oxidoreductase n=1 Tax=Sphingomonas sp. 10B4 TaxID=3048575 RepID=UPI002AB56DF0|nr:DsbA family oxidoreductase [Sphingomonas sp. 10B4]MDY7525277.1 DsbA family oxidoreductase [Sphingomonas sp. 10B4]MEB0282774.1 DsbA family oxidoreductase [Sphingomonas sp. 10B4]
MPKPMKIDFVSDVSCPWCIIGLRALEDALARTSDVVDAEITFQPFELNPQMGKDGQNIGEHIAEKYGATPEQSAANRATIRERAADLGFTMAMGADSRIYNTFDAHRLLHWAELEGKQADLKRALFQAYFTDQQDPSDHAVLVALAEKVGLDRARAAEILESDAYTREVRAAEQLWQSRGITSVPAIIINDRHLISGGQPTELFERAIREIAAA